jgi:acetyl esterase/lipase
MAFLVLLALNAGPVLGDGPQPFVMESFLDLAYRHGPDADPVRHRLDIYVPQGLKEFPVVFFIHGGAWIEGNKNHFGIYRALAKALTRHGIGMVSTNYRLSPAVKHPEHIKDVAQAFAWTYRNIGKYGGKVEELFVVGHSAGGHLAALLATDESYLREHKLSAKQIRGVIPISGVFNIGEEPVYAIAFGKDLKVRKAASPVHHARPEVPPFLILFAENELPPCDKKNAQAFCQALVEKKAPAQAWEIPNRNHISILVNAISDSDPMFRTLLNFVATQVALDRLVSRGPEGIDFLFQTIGVYASSQANGR